MMKKFFSYMMILSVIFLQTSSVCATSARKSEPEYFIFIGNPGVGKSTLINSIIGKKVASAGVSAGIGMTKFFTGYNHEGNVFMDTPGLADIELRKQAGEEIERALKKDGTYRIFFVLTLDSGRVRTEDVATINTVMDALPDSGDRFNIIINKVTKKEKNEILKDPQKMALVYSAINSGRNKTDNIYYIALDRKMEDSESDFIEIDTLLAEFMFGTSASINIASKDVRNINTDQYEAIKAIYAENMKLMQEQVKSGNETTQALINQMMGLQQMIAAQAAAAAAAEDRRNRSRSRSRSRTRVIEKTEIIREPFCTIS